MTTSKHYHKHIAKALFYKLTIKYNECVPDTLMVHIMKVAQQDMFEPFERLEPKHL